MWKASAPAPASREQAELARGEQVWVCSGLQPPRHDSLTPVRGFSRPMEFSAIDLQSPSISAVLAPTACLVLLLVLANAALTPLVSLCKPLNPDLAPGESSSRSSDRPTSSRSAPGGSPRPATSSIHTGHLGPWRPDRSPPVRRIQVQFASSSAHTGQLLKPHLPNSPSSFKKRLCVGSSPLPTLLGASQSLRNPSSFG